jgi:hypothetical protein
LTILKTVSSGLPLASSCVQPVSDSATGLRNVTRPSVSVPMTASSSCPTAGLDRPPRANLELRHLGDEVWRFAACVLVRPRRLRHVGVPAARRLLPRGFIGQDARNAQAPGHRSGRVPPPDRGGRTVGNTTSGGSPRCRRAVRYRDPRNRVASASAGGPTAMSPPRFTGSAATRAARRGPRASPCIRRSRRASLRRGLCRRRSRSSR